MILSLFEINIRLFKAMTCVDFDFNMEKQTQEAQQCYTLKKKIAWTERFTY